MSNESIARRCNSITDQGNSFALRRLFDANFVDTTAIAAYLTSLSAFMIADAIIVPTVLGIGSTDTDVASTAFSYQIDGASYYKAAVAAGTAWTSSDTINTATAAGLLWGGWRFQIDSSGTITSTSVGADQVYATEALAIADIPAATAGTVSMGYVTIQANTGAAWTANTDDLVAASDCAAVNYYSDATDVPSAPTLTIIS